MKRIFILKIVLLLFLCTTVNSQVLPTVDFNDVLPPSPTAAGLGKYGEFPVNYYTGVPNISIPLFDLIGSKIGIPLSISYHASGVKVDEVPGWVGLGWSLNAGGCITRSVRGLPDDKENGYLQIQLPETIIPDSSAHRIMLNRIAAGQLDGEPDLFYFNFGGHSGKFVFTNDSIAHVIPYQKLKIEPQPYNPSIGIIEWKVTDESGTIYTFGGESALERTSTYGNCQSRTPQNTDIPTSWYLKKIESPDGSDFISFQYNSYSLSYDQASSETDFYMVHGGSSRDYYRCNNRITIDGRYLKEIVASTGSKVNFEVDPITYAPSHRLKSIALYNNLDTLVKEYDFKYSLFPDLCETDGGYQKCHRIRLDSIIENGIREYSFEYNSEPLPRRNSPAQDHWGFYNGAIDNENLRDGAGSRIPTLRVNNNRLYSMPQNSTNFIPEIKSISGKPYWYWEAANRDPEAEKAKAGILQKIVYPTGGYTTFEYEQNEFSFLSDRKQVSFYNYDARNASLLSPDNEFWTTDFDIDHYQPIVIDYSFLSNVNPNLYPSYDIVTLKIIKKGSPNTCVWQKTYCNAYLPENCYPPRQEAIGSVSQSFEGEVLLLDSGEYYMEFTPWSTLQDPNHRARGMMNIKFNELCSVDNIQKGGGLRIRKIVSHDGISPESSITKRYEYKMGTTDPLIDPNTSSGVLMDNPLYYSIVTQSDCQPDGGGSSPVYFQEPLNSSDYLWMPHHLAVSSASNLPLGNVNGNPIGYRVVSEYTDEVTNGRTVYEFITPIDPDMDETFSIKYPFAPKPNFDWKYGLTKSISSYKENGTLLKREEHNYNYIHDSINRNTINGIKSIINCVSTNTTDCPCNLPFCYEQYFLISAWNYMTEKKVYVYPDVDVEIITTEKFYYENPGHAQLTKQETSNSDGSLAIRTFKYPADYSDGSGDDYAEAITRMKGPLHIHNAVIENLHWIQKFPQLDEILTYGRITQYKEFRDNQMLPAQILEIETKDPLSQFQVSAIADTLSYDSNYKTRIHVESYDSLGNLQEYRDEHDYWKSIIWAKGGSNPIVAVNNAGITDILFTDFENDREIMTPWSSGSSYTLDPSQAMTGDYSMRITNPSSGEWSLFSRFLPINNDIARKYKYSCWVYSDGPSADLLFFWKPNRDENPYSQGWDHVFKRTHVTNKWVYLEGEVLVPSTAQSIYLMVNNNGGGDVWFDDLRLYPADAEMTTYTYKPLVGMTSQTDTNGRAIYYEYDGFGRLKIIRDHNRNILKRIDYNYSR